VNNNRCFFFGLIIILILSFACAPGPGQRTELLLQRDHQQMSDEQLQTYYRELGDQLVRETRARREAGLLTRPAETDRLELLRARWNEVRSELRQRELLP